MPFGKNIMTPFDMALVEQMRETALAYPHNPFVNPLAPIETAFPEVVFENEVLNLQLTYEYFTPQHEGQGWHLSVSRPDRQPVEDAVLWAVVYSVLGTEKRDGDLVEITQKMPVEWRFVRQFVKKEHRRFDPLHKVFLS